MTNSFGYLTKEGYGGHVFPVVFGEVGSHLTAVRTLHYSAAASLVRSMDELQRLVACT